MQIVIEIDDELYQMCKDLLGDADPIESAIANGIPLPKGHGRLIDYGYAVDVIDDWINAEKHRYTNATNVIKKLTFYYNEALKIEAVIKPLSWALYHTWKDVDAKEKSRKREEQA